MRRSSFALTTALLASAAASAWLGMQWAAERDRTAALQDELRALRAREPAPPRVRIEAASAMPRPAPAAVSAPAPVPVPAATETETAPAPIAGGRDFSAEQQRLLRSNPEYRNAMRVQQRLNVERMYRDLPALLELSPERADRMFELMTDERMSRHDGAPGRAASPDEAARLARAADERRRAYDATLKELLGESNMQRLEEYRASFQSRNEVRMLAGELAGGPDPLREDQMEPLIALVHEQQKRLQQEWSDLGASNTAPESAEARRRRSQLAVAANERIVEAAGSLLSSRQHAALEDFYRRQKLQMESRDEMNRIMREVMSRAKTPPAR